MTIKQAFEIFAVVGRGYNQRDTKGWAWTPEAAAEIVKRYPGEELETSIIHLIQVGHYLHRVHVIPVGEVEGDPDIAVPSRLEHGDIKGEVVPAVYIEVRGRKKLRLSNKVDKSLGYIESLPRKTTCRLFTMRRDAPPDLTFVVQDLFENERVQREVWDWLNYESKVRTK